jgi:hypothetical protein
MFFENCFQKLWVVQQLRIVVRSYFNTFSISL